MPGPLFSIGVSMLDAERFLRPCLASIFAQSCSDWELLLQDDGSSDRSLELARSVQDRRVQVLSDGLTLGLAVRLNQMARAAQGRYFVRMDADDVMHPSRLATLCAVLGPEDEPQVVGSRAYVIDAEHRVHGVRGAPPGRGWAVRHAFIHPTVAAPVAWFRANPYCEDLWLRRCEDAELWSRTAASTRFLVLPQPLLYYREVGLFNLRKYRATQAGMAEVVRRHYARPRLRAFGRRAGLPSCARAATASPPSPGPERPPGAPALNGAGRRRPGRGPGRVAAGASPYRGTSGMPEEPADAPA